MHRPWFDHDTRRPVLVGYAPRRPALDGCAPSFPELERVAGERLFATCAAVTVFSRHDVAWAASPGRVRALGTTLRSSTFGRVLVVVGAAALAALSLAGLPWFAWYGDGDHLVTALPDDLEPPGYVRRALCEARLAALHYAHERGV